MPIDNNFENGVVRPRQKDLGAAKCCIKGANVSKLVAHAIDMEEQLYCR